jgi:lactoylglutathione lyase
MEYLHTMIRVGDIDAALRFFCDGLGLAEYRRSDYEGGRFTLIFLAAPADIKRQGGDINGHPLQTNIPMIELTYNWPDEDSPAEIYTGGRNFGHLAFRTDDIYARCQHLSDMGYVIHRPPRDGRMAFIKSPDGISVELLQKDEPLAPQEPWVSAENIGTW